MEDAVSPPRHALEQLVAAMMFRNCRRHTEPSRIWWVSGLLGLLSLTQHRVGRLFQLLPPLVIAVCGGKLRKYEADHDEWPCKPLLPTAPAPAPRMAGLVRKPLVPFRPSTNTQRLG